MIELVTEEYGVLLDEAGLMDMYDTYEHAFKACQRYGGIGIVKVTTEVLELWDGE